MNILFRLGETIQMPHTKFIKPILWYLYVHILLWRRREDNIRIELRDIGSEGVDWMHLVQDRDHRQALVNTAMMIRVLYKGRNFLN